MRLDGSGTKRPNPGQSGRSKQPTKESCATGGSRQSQRQLAIRAAREEGKLAQDESCQSQLHDSKGAR